MPLRVKRTQSEISECLRRCAIADYDGSMYGGMTYEEGVRDAIEWLLGIGETEPEGYPFEDEVGEYGQ